MGNMTLDKIAPRKTAKELLPNADPRTLAAVESELNYEWWRGYFAAQKEAETKDD